MSTSKNVRPIELVDMMLDADGPYVLLRIKPSEDPGEMYTLSLTGGGGVKRPETMLAFLAQTLWEATGIDSERLLNEINEKRAERGEPDFLDAAFGEDS